MVLNHAQAEPSLTVAVASSFYETMQQHAPDFEKKHDVTIRLVSGSTGRLYNQIMQGAPFDVFIAADRQRPELLMQQGKGKTSMRISQTYLGLQIGQTLSQDLNDLQQPKVRHIAIANPRVAPFGQAAKAVLQQHQLWHSLKPKLVYAQNALQANMMLAKGLVDAAFIPTTSAKHALATLPYVGVVLTRHKKAHIFLEFIHHLYEIHPQN